MHERFKTTQLSKKMDVLIVIQLLGGCNNLENSYMKRTNSNPLLMGFEFLPTLVKTGTWEAWTWNQLGEEIKTGVLVHFQKL